MPRPIARVVLAGVLLVGAGCGTDPEPDPSPDTAWGISSDTASPSGTPSRTPEPEETGPEEMEHRVVAVVSVTNAGGTVTGVPVRLDDEAAVNTWTSQFSGEGLREQVVAAVDKAREIDDQVALGVVLSIGCEEPPDWVLLRDDEGLRVRVPKPAKTVQCLAPVTTVAVLAVDPETGAWAAAPE